MRLIVGSGSEKAALAEVPCPGGKNAMNHALAVGFLLGPGARITISNVPEVSDKYTVTKMLGDCDSQFEQSGGSLTVHGQVPRSRPDLSAQTIQRIRASSCMLVGAALRHGAAHGFVPGGDAFAPRPVDLHQKVVRAAGGFYDIDPLSGRIQLGFGPRVRPLHIDLMGPYGSSVGATVSALLVAAVADGESWIGSAAREIEVEVVTDILTQLGVSVSRDGPNLLVVPPHQGLSGHAVVDLPTDQSVAGTYLLAGVLANEKVVITDTDKGVFNKATLEVFDQSGIDIRQTPAGLEATLTEGIPRPVTIATGPHPGFYTDLQPQLAAFLTHARGKSTITETVYSSRVSHVAPLSKLGAGITLQGRDQHISGPTKIRDGSYHVKDIRSGAAAIVASAGSSCSVEIRDDDRHLDRAYPDISNMLQTLNLLKAST